MSIDNQREWRRHCVRQQALSPYVKLHSECTSTDKQRLSQLDMDPPSTSQPATGTTIVAVTCRDGVVLGVALAAPPPPPAPFAFSLRAMVPTLPFRTPRSSTGFAVLAGADSRVSTGTYVSNRASDKITSLSDYIYLLRSGSAADTQVPRC